MRLTLRCAVVIGMATLISLIGAGQRARADQPTRISGFAVDVEGKPIEGARVGVLSGNTYVFRARTDRNGFFVILGVESGAQRIVAEAPGFDSCDGIVELTYGDDARLTMHFLRRVDLLQRSWITESPRASSSDLYVIR